MSKSLFNLNNSNQLAKLNLCYNGGNKQQVKTVREFNHNYPSDITREQYEIIREELEYSKKAKTREIDLYSVFCAVLYLLKGGIQWRMMPSDFPDHAIVRYYYDKWTRPKRDGTTVLSDVLKKIGNNAQKRRTS